MDATTEKEDKEAQLHDHGFHLYGEGPDGEMRYVNKGPYHTAAEGFTGRGEHIGLVVGTGVRGQVKEQGCGVIGDEARHSGLQEEVLFLVYVMPLACGAKEAVGTCARKSSARTSYLGRGRRRGCISLISRWISQRPRASPKRGSSTHLPRGPTANRQLGRQSRPLWMSDASRARRLPRSTRRAKLVEFVGRVLCLGRGRGPLRGDALPRAATRLAQAEARGILAKLCEVGGMHARATAKLMGSTDCLGRPAVSGGRRRR